MTKRYCPLMVLFNSNRPLLSVIVKDTSEESFFCNSEMVAFSTGCFASVSNREPLIVPFCPGLAVAQKSSTMKIKLNCLIADGLSYESIPANPQRRLSRLVLMLSKVNTWYRILYSRIAESDPLIFLCLRLTEIRMDSLQPSKANKETTSPS